MYFLINHYIFFFAMDTGILCFLVPMIIILIIMLLVLANSVLDGMERKDIDRKQAVEAKERAQETARLEEERVREIATRDEIQARKIAKLNQEHLEALAKIEEENKYWEDNHDRFCKSPEYIFIEQFVKKYQHKVNDRELSKLQLLLKNRKWNFSEGQVEYLIEEEQKKQRLEVGKSKILKSNALGLRGFIEAYLENFQSDDEEMLVVLSEVLWERELFDGDLDQLEIEVRKVEDEIEVENFEKRLFEETEQLLLEDIDEFGGYEFEGFLKKLFTKMGYQVEQTRLSGDQGADLVVVKFGERTVIQAKRFSAKVGNKAVQEIMAAISFYQAQNGMVITNNYFTAAAVELAEANNIELVNRDDLEELISNYW